MVGEGVVRIKSRGQERLYDKEHYIDFRMRLLGESGLNSTTNYHEVTTPFRCNY